MPSRVACAATLKGAPPISFLSSNMSHKTAPSTTRSKLSRPIATSWSCHWFMLVLPARSRPRTKHPPMGHQALLSEHRILATFGKGQPERDHLLAVTNQQGVACQHRVVPGLAFYCRKPRKLCKPVGGRRD